MVTLTRADALLVLAALRRSVPPPDQQAATDHLARRLERALTTHRGRPVETPERPSSTETRPDTPGGPL
jgi:hypothetical protein